MVVGSNATLTARVYGAGDNLLPTARVHWSSQDPGVVTITQDGVATAVATGTAQIAASAGGQSRTIAVTVSQQPIALIRISPPAGNVAVGGTLTLQGEALDGTGAVLPNRLLEWTSSAPEIATVNATGVVTGVSVGQATIAATGEGKTGTALITVFPTPIATIDIEPDGGTLPAGATRLFVATPRDASGQPLTGRTLEWRSSNDAVATVSSSGLLTAISPGTVTITVSAPGGGPGGTTPSASVSVTVLIEPVASAAVVPATASVQVGQTVDLTVNLFNSAGDPLSPAGRGITWSSSDASIATINSSGRVTGVAIGGVTITATVTTPAQPGSVQATAQVTVSSQPVASVVITPAAGTVHVRYSRQLSAVARNAAGTVLPGRPIIWTSSNQAIATVDQLGVVVGVSQGSVLIRATSEGVQAAANIDVDLVAVSSVSVSPASATLTPLQTVQLAATPRDSAGSPITGPALGGRPTAWTSLNTAIATVNGNGLVTAVAQGSAGVRATIGGTNGQSAITVNPLPGASQLVVTTQPSPSAQNDVAFPVQPVVQLRDASGGNVATAGVVIQAAITAPGSGTLGGTVTATTNASGAATFSGLKITGSTGARTLTFTSGSLTPATSNAINILPGPATQLVLTTPPPSSANSGQVFSAPTVVQLRDVSGNNVPQAGVSVTAAVSPSAGVTLGGASTTTNGSGTATFGALSLTGPAGSYTLTFSSGALAPVTSGPITLGAGGGSALALTIQPSATAPSGVAFAAQPQVRLQDGSGNPVAQGGVVVTAAILTGGGTLGGTTTATTNASGVATFSNLSITGTVGPRTLLFGASGYTTVSSNPINITPGPATSLSLTAQPSATAQSDVPFGSQPVVQLQDASGNAVAQGGVTVSVSVNGVGAALIGSSSTITNSSGVATFSGLGLSGAAGSYSLTFSASGLTGVTSSSISLIAGAATQLTITTQPAGGSSGAAFATQPAIQLRDAGGSVVNQAGVIVTASVASGAAGATLVGSPSATTNSSGLATFSGLGISGTAGSYTLTFASGSLTGVTSAVITLGPGAPAQLSIQTQPAGAVSGMAFTTQPAILVRDAQNNAVAAGVTVTASVNGAGASLIGTPTAQTNASGVATFSGLGLNGTAGTYTLDFAVSGAPNVTSGPIALGAGGAAQLTMATQPSASVASGNALATAPAVQLRDAGGNAVSQAGVSVSVAISGSGASLTGATTAQTDASGIATFAGLGITGAAGNYTLQFSSAGLTGATSVAISVTPGAAAALAMSTQPPGAATSGAAFSNAPAVQLRDASGNAVSQSGVTVTASVTGGGATLVGSTSANTDASGIATFSGLGISGAGTWTIDFASTGLSGVTSSAIVVTVPATQLSMASQPSATAQSGQAFATQPSVRLHDSGGNPVAQAGVTVTAGITGGGSGASLLGTATAQTDASGTASFTNLGIAGPVGSYTLTFTASGLTDAVSNIINLAAGTAAKLSITQQPAGTTSGSPLTSQPVIQLLDAQDNPSGTAGITVTATLNGTGGTLTGGAAVATNASGQASFTDLGISGSGTYTITFSASGLTGVTSQNITIAFLNLSQAQPAVINTPTRHVRGGTLHIAENTVGVPGFRIVPVGSVRRSSTVSLDYTPMSERP